MEAMTFQSRIGLAEPLPEEEYLRLRAKWHNETEGTRHLEDGYSCTLCRNKGYSMEVRQDGGDLRLVTVPCSCEPVRRSILRMKKSGLEHQIRSCTFDSFQEHTPWQRAMKADARAYAEDPRGWFFVGGQSGAGKTHLCTAICRELLLQGREVVYMLWRDEIVRLKGAVTEADQYTGLIDRYKRAEVLYIDDLFKTGKGRDGHTPQPSPADIHTAFEILNFRYCDPNKLTILTSELTARELLEVDEALAGRILERAQTIHIGKDREKNWRLQGRH